MSRMSQTELRLWQDRLTHAHSFWRDEGLTGESADRMTVADISNFYRGKHWQTTQWGGLPRSELVTVNLMFSSTNTLMAGLSARAARPVIKPKGQDLASDDAARRASLNEILLASVATDLKIKRQVDMAVLDAALFPAGFVQHVYVPREEKYDTDGTLIDLYDPARPDFPGIRRRRISEVRVDPLASSLYPDEDARWVAFRDLYLLEDVKRSPAFVSRKDLRPTYVIALDPMRAPSLARDGGPDECQLVEIWTVYDKTERKVFALSPGSELALREPESWPIGWDSLPYDVLFFNPRPDSMIPVALPETYIELQIEANKVRTMMAALTKRQRHLVIVNDDAMKDGEAEKMVDAELMEFFFSKGIDPRAVAAEIKLGSFPQELLFYYQAIKDDIREVIGISNMDRAQRINVQTATEAQGVMTGSTILRSRAQEKVEEFWSNIFRKLHRGIQQTQTEDILLPVFDMNGVRDLLAESVEGGGIRIRPNDLRGEFHYGVQVGSTLPEDPEAESRRNVAVFNLFKDDPLVNQRDLRHDVLSAFRKDADRLLATSNSEMGANMNDLGMIGVGRSLAAPEPGSRSQGANGSAAKPPSGIDPALMARLSKPGSA